jgi:hypothetical protein
MYPTGCKGKQTCFGRPADLDRHYQNVHADADMRKKFICDYSKCGRSQDPFTRKDHYRDHLRDFHKEDIGCAKGENSKTKTKEIWEIEQEQWKHERKIYPHYWRCSRCLDRITVSRDNWECPRCKTPCERERINARLGTRTSTPTGPREGIFNAMDEDTGYLPTRSSNPVCATCAGTGYVDGGCGSCVQCATCEPPQLFFIDNSYSTTMWS